MKILRSLMIGDTDHYFSPYIFGIAQACARLGIWHSQISSRVHINDIDQRIRDVQPNLIWTHMLLWPPPGSVPKEQIIGLCHREKRQHGAHVMLHDGDVKAPTRHAQDISGFVSLALCNHKHDRSAWKVPQVYWPYAAFPQDKLAAPQEEWQCNVAFAGQLSNHPIYAGRTRLVNALKKNSNINFKVFNGEPNTMLRTPELAVSALGILGFGRPGKADDGWVDTRVFQYPGAGGILIHDDVRGFLEPHIHYIPYRTGNVDSVIEAVGELKRMTEPYLTTMRLKTMKYVQEHHSWTARVKEVLAALGVQP